LALADREKDGFFEQKNTTEVDKAYLRGQLQMIDEIVGLVAFMKAFKVPEVK